MPTFRFTKFKKMTINLDSNVTCGDYQVEDIIEAPYTKEFSSREEAVFYGQTLIKEKICEQIEIAEIFKGSIVDFEIWVFFVVLQKEEGGNKIENGVTGGKRL